jgi:hypothetical protein
MTNIVTIRCEHCKGISQVEPNGCSEIEVKWIGGHHRVSFQTPAGSTAVPRVVVSDDILNEVALE